MDKIEVEVEVPKWSMKSDYNAKHYEAGCGREFVVMKKTVAFEPL